MLRKLPARAEAFLAANRRNSLKSTGARTAKGKARPCLNALKHGRYARLPETPTAAGDRGGALYQKVRGGIGTAFRAQPHEPREMRCLDRMTAWIWCLAGRAGVILYAPMELKSLVVSSLCLKRKTKPRRGTCF